MCVCHHPFVWRVFLMLCFPFSLDICQQSRKSCFIFENNCGKVLVVSEKCVPLHPLSPFRGRQPSKRDHWKDYIHRQVVQEKRGCLFGALGYKWTSVAALPRTLYYIYVLSWGSGGIPGGWQDRLLFYYLMFPFPVIRGEVFGRFGGVLRQTTLSGPQPFPFWGYVLR